jgi:nitrogen regulatory protein PII
MNTCLTIVLPKFFEEDVVDHLLEHPEWVSGFTTTDVNGHGHSVAYHATAEEVRGRASRVQVQIVMTQEHAQPLIAHLKERLHSAEIAYWLTPVIEFGRFA